jgi:hypothetical protein
MAEPDIKLAERDLAAGLMADKDNSTTHTSNASFGIEQVHYLKSNIYFEIMLVASEDNKEIQCML